MLTQTMIRRWGWGGVGAGFVAGAVIDVVFETALMRD
jgi:hypothetical protein